MVIKVFNADQDPSYKVCVESMWTTILWLLQNTRIQRKMWAMGLNNVILDSLDSKAMMLDTKTHQLTNVPKNFWWNSWFGLLSSITGEILGSLCAPWFDWTAICENLHHPIHVLLIEYLQEHAFLSLWWLYSTHSNTSVQLLALHPNFQTVSNLL